MFFRKAKNRINIIKAQYQKAEGGQRGYSKQIHLGSLDAYEPEVTDELASKLAAKGCTDEEIQQVRDYVETLKAEAKIDTLTASVTLLSGRITRTAVALETDAGKAALTPEVADQIFAAMKHLRDVMRSAGVVEKRPSRKDSIETQGSK